ncbi:hypothetical protein E0504_04445 [Parafrankia sp. BMG5.11]|nr:hypothetical protein E0504_04445 [Parafrankia sp. BMG5.11]
MAPAGALSVVGLLLGSRHVIPNGGPVEAPCSARARHGDRPCLRAASLVTLRGCVSTHRDQRCLMGRRRAGLGRAHAIHGLAARSGRR